MLKRIVLQYEQQVEDESIEEDFPGMSLFLPHSCCYLISMSCRVDNKKGQTAARRSLGRLWELAAIPGTRRCEDSECCSEGKRISLFNFLVLLFLI